MRSLQVVGAEQVEIIEIDRPRCGPYEVLIHMKACAICNQHDAAVFAGHPHGGERQYPLEPGFPGHEGAGEVVEVGERVTDLAVGDHVCTTGIGGPPLYSEYVTRQAGTAVRIRPEIEFIHAAPLELFGCVHRAFTLTDPVAGRRVGVVGLGPAGQAAVALARAYGAAEVVGFDLAAARREKAREMGATETVDASVFLEAHEAVKARIAGDETPTDPHRAALEAVRANACEVVFECSGNAASTQNSFLLAGRELTIFGYVRDVVEALPCLWFQKELVIRNSKILDLSDLRAVAGLLDEGRIDTRPIVTGVMNFTEYRDAIERIARREAIKIALKWD